jgi:hypothetical protein
LREIQADLAATQAQAQQALTLASELAPVVQGLQCLPPPREFKRVRYGQFYNTATQTQTSTNVAVPVAFNTTDISVGVRLRSPSTSEIEVDTEGIYNFQASMQFDSASGSNPRGLGVVPQERHRHCEQRDVSQHPEQSV